MTVDTPAQASHLSHDQLAPFLGEMLLIRRVMAELYGKVECCSSGYGGSMHLYDVARGNMGANAVVVAHVYAEES